MAALEERQKELLHSDIGDAISLMFVAVEKSVLVTKTTKHVNFMDGVDVQERAVENIHHDNVWVFTKVQCVQVMNENGNRGVEQNKSMEIPVRHVWYWLIL